MSVIYELISILRISIIPIGLTLRCIICLIEIIYNEDERRINLKRIKNAVIFLILAETIFTIQELIQIYYKKFNQDLV